jgi:thioredoxin 1
LSIDGLLHAEIHLGECGGFVGQSVVLLARGRTALCASVGAQARMGTETTEKEGGDMATVTEPNDSAFPKAIKDGVTLVDVLVPWCAPCMMQGPIVERVAETLDDRAMVAKVNVDEALQTASELGIRSIPTIIVFKEGKPVQHFVAVTQAGALLAAIEEAL